MAFHKFWKAQAYLASTAGATPFKVKAGAAGVFLCVSLPVTHITWIHQYLHGGYIRTFGQQSHSTFVNYALTLGLVCTAGYIVSQMLFRFRQSAEILKISGVFGSCVGLISFVVANTLSPIPGRSPDRIPLIETLFFSGLAGVATGAYIWIAQHWSERALSKRMWFCVAVLVWSLVTALIRMRLAPYSFDYSKAWFRDALFAVEILPAGIFLYGKFSQRLPRRVFTSVALDTFVGTLVFFGPGLIIWEMASLIWPLLGFLNVLPYIVLPYVPLVVGIIVGTFRWHFSRWPVPATRGGIA